MEVRGMVLLRIADPSLTGICMMTDNFDSRGFQMQVSPFSMVSIRFHILRCLGELKVDSFVSVL